MVLGVAFDAITGSSDCNSNYKKQLERIYNQVLNKGLKLYVSVENISSSIKAINYYSNNIYKAAIKLRKEMQCDNFLNVGWLDQPTDLSTLLKV